MTTTANTPYFGLLDESLSDTVTDDGELVSAIPFFRTGHNYNRDAASYNTGLECKDPSLTQQQFAEEADINTIVKRFGLTGQLPTNGVMPVYADFEEVIDYQTAQNAIRRAEEAFMALPGLVRQEFSNDPQRFVEFCSNPANIEKARELGLATPAKASPSPTEIPPPAPAKPPGNPPA